MAFESFLGLDPIEKFELRRKHLAETKYEDEIEANHPTRLCLPQISLKLNSLHDANDHSKKIAMKFNKGTTTLSFVYKGGIMVCADSRATGGEYISSGNVKKIIIINDYLVGTMAGGAADCSYWQRVLSEHCRMFELRNKERISVAAASKLLANILYNYKGMGLSLGSMICGWDKVKGSSIFYVDNDGNRFPGKMFSVGSGSPYAYGVLDTFYRYDMTDEEAYDLGRRAIFHAAHRDAASGGKIRDYQR
ncbi:hypothetical protein RDWZM_004353 [Blomia tropicalis]|uniref:Proteasome subunit beta n=1 Tax=Blomia tropicalis TaxID=40697 RepID=A0A9Q0MIM1_BLOTA|nr:hypothetical protein RDWZM_004353 [Blomia tropicalis]